MKRLPLKPWALALLVLLWGAILVQYFRAFFSPFPIEEGSAKTAELLGIRFYEYRHVVEGNRHLFHKDFNGLAIASFVAVSLLVIALGYRSSVASSAHS